MTIFARPSEWTRPRVSQPQALAPHSRAQHYFAFLSYSHRDEDMAKWLHESLESFRVPRHLVGKLTDNGPIPRRLTPIFRDIGELPASDDLGTEIHASIAGSRFLIVLCSPASAVSKWTNAEIETFKRARPEGCILAAIVAGEPFASDIPDREAEECLPPALRYKYDRRGRRTAKRAEPLAADLREPGEARRVGVLKLIAGMLGVGLDELIQRESQRRHRRMAAVTGSSVVGMLIAAGLAVTAVQARDEARDQRREAESLIAFMLGDLRDKLEPIGKLDTLDGVGSRILAYYRQQDASELSDAALSQRSSALSLMAAVANSRGDFDGALGLYREAAAGTAEAIKRDRSDPQRLFDHAQNVFYIGEIKRGQGDNSAAEASMREYQRLARKMVQLEPDNMKWRMEVQYADANLGIMLYGQRRFAEATRQFREALRTIQAIATADPNNLDYQQNLGEGLAWLADSQSSEGRLDEAIAARRQHTALLARLLAGTGSVEYRQRLVPAERSLANLYARRGRLDLAIAHAQAAVNHGRRLLPVEPANKVWRDYTADAELDLARFLLSDGQQEQAAVHARASCELIDGLIASDSSAPEWRAGLRDCWRLRARMALMTGAVPRAVEDARRAVDIARSVKTIDPETDLYALAAAYRLLGEAQSSRGDRNAAVAAWHAALASLPRGVTERPEEMSERLRILRKLGRTAEADALTRRLSAIGYRYPDFTSA